MPARSQQTKRHDIEFGGHGYQLAKSGPVTPQGGTRPSWEEQRVRFAAARVADDAQGYENWSPEEEAVWQITDYERGFGHPVWSDGTYAYSGSATTGGGIDPRIPSELKLAPLVSSGVTTNTESRLYDNFERSIGGTSTVFGCFGRKIMYWTDPASPNNESRDSGTGIYHTSASNFQGTAEKLYTYIAVRSSTGTPLPYLTFDGAGNTSTYAKDSQDTDIAPAAGIFSDNGTYTSDTAAPIALTLNSLVAAQDAVYIVGDQTFEGAEIAVGNANGSSSTLTAKYWDGDSWEALSGVTDGTASSGASFGQTGNITWTIPSDWEITKVDATVGYAVQFTFGSNFDSSVTTTDIDLIQRDTAEFFRVFEGQLYRIVKTAGGYDLTNSENGGTGASWATIGTVTPLSNPITGMFAAMGRLCITAEEGFFVLSSSGEDIDEEIWPHPNEVSDSQNGVGSTNWGGDLWLTLRRGQYRIFDNQGTLFINRNVGTQVLRENSTPARGRMTCLGGDDYYLYGVLQNESGVSYLMSFDPNEEVWHTLNNLGSITSRHMWLSDVGHATNPLLYFNAGTNIRYIILPRSSPNPSHDSACLFALTGTIYLGQFHAAFIREVKAWLESQSVTEAASSAQTVKYEYRTTDDGSWTTLGTYDTDPGGRLTFSVSPTSRMIDVRLTLVTDSTASTPLLRAIQTRYAVRFPYKRRFQFAVWLSDFQATGSGQESRSAAQRETQIISAVESNATVTLVKPTGVSFDVLPLDGRAFIVEDENRRPVEWAFFVEAIEHQATEEGTHNNLSSYTHNQLAAWTHDELNAGNAA